MKTKLKKGDQVQISAGKDKGKSGRILRIDRSAGRIIVEGLNMVKKTQRPKTRNDKGGIIEIEAPIAFPTCGFCAGNAAPPVSGSICRAKRNPESAANAGRFSDAREHREFRSSAENPLP